MRDCDWGWLCPLECLTKPSNDELEGDEAAGKLQKAQVDVCTAFPPDEQPPETVEPGNGSLDLPAMTAQALFRLYLRAGDPGQDAAATTGRAVFGGAVALVRMQLFGSLARPAARSLNRLYRIQHRLQHVLVADVGSRQIYGQR